MPHSDRGLFDHLLGTRQLLVEWGSRPALCDAGLFHSIYSTEHYEQTAVALTRRDEVRQLIGEEAESLVWLFCMMRREAFFLELGKDRSPSVQHRETGEQIPLSGTQHQDLLTLLFANSLEAFPDVPGSSGAVCAWRFDTIGSLPFHRSKGRSTDLMFGGGRFGNEQELDHHRTRRRLLHHGVALSHVIEPGVRVEKIMLTTNTPALRLFPATPGPHPKALLAHGGGGSKEMLFRFGEAFAAAGFDCYSVDLAGQGESPQPCSLTNIVLSLQESARALGAVDVFIGHSLGSAVGSWSVREDGFWPKLFIGLEGMTDFAERGPPLLLLVSRFGEFGPLLRPLVENTNECAGGLFSVVRTHHRSLRCGSRECRCESGVRCDGQNQSPLPRRRGGGDWSVFCWESRVPWA
jgi:hypothetical protein